MTASRIQFIYHFFARYRVSFVRRLVQTNRVNRVFAKTGDRLLSSQPFRISLMIFARIDLEAEHCQRYRTNRKRAIDRCWRNVSKNSLKERVSRTRRVTQIRTQSILNCHVNVAAVVRARATLTAQLTLPLIIHRYGFNRTRVLSMVKDKGSAYHDTVA